MQIESNDFLSDARAMRVQYIRGLLSHGWNAVLDLFQAAGQFPMRETMQ
jgi:hypothetical protein